jgi:hypothetical protein
MPPPDGTVYQKESPMSIRNWLGRPLAVAIISVGAIGATASVANAHTAPAHVRPAAVVQPFSAGDGTPAGAVAWYKAHLGSTGWEGMCELAAENSYGTSGVWASAIAHWNGASPKHPGNYSPPLGSFVYWNISSYGHVGISDGNGGAYASSVNGAIGHITSLDYFSSYLGWTPAAVPHQ